MSRQGERPQPPQRSPGEGDAWLARPSTIRRLWWAFGAILALSVAAQLVFKVKGYFGIDGWFGFAAGYGFLACFAMVVFAKALGRFVKRDVTYYRVDEDD